MNVRLTASLLVLAAVLPTVGFHRPRLDLHASDAASADPGVAAAGRDAFETASTILRTAIGDTLGYFRTAVWAVLVLVALGRGWSGRWFAALGAGSAALVLAGVLSPLGLPVIDTANFVGYSLWCLWLVAFAVVIVVRERRTAGGRAGTPAAGYGARAS